MAWLLILQFTDAGSQRATKVSRSPNKETVELENRFNSETVGTDIKISARRKSVEKVTGMVGMHEMQRRDTTRSNKFKSGHGHNDYARKSAQVRWAKREA